MVYQQAESGEGMVGTGGTEIWKFMAVKKGKTSLWNEVLPPLRQTPGISLSNETHHPLVPPGFPDH